MVKKPRFIDLSTVIPAERSEPESITTILSSHKRSWLWIPGSRLRPRRNDSSHFHIMQYRATRRCASAESNTASSAATV